MRFILLLFVVLGFLASCDSTKQINSAPSKPSYIPVDNTPGTKEAADVNSYTPFGMPNIGNTCFSNAAIQAFISSSKKEILTVNYEVDSILGLLKNMIIYKDDNSKIDFIKKTALQLGCPIGKQLDSLKFFEDFLKEIGKENPKLLSSFHLKNQLSTWYCDTKKVEEDKSKFHLMDQSLQLQEQGDTVQEVLNNRLFKIDKSGLDCGSDCHKACERILSFAWPNNLIIANPRKPGIPFVASEELLINANSSHDGHNKKYELISLVIHRGTPSSGHYWALVKFGKNWFDCNDLTVSSIDKSRVFSTTEFQYAIYKLI